MGEQWSFLRSVLAQGMDIQQDCAAGRYPSYEQLSARLDEAAREREEEWNLRTPLTPAERSAVEALTESAVHGMCAYLSKSKHGFGCSKCPKRVDSPYGPGELGCYGIAEETLKKAAELLGAVKDEK